MIPTKTELWIPKKTGRPYSASTFIKSKEAFKSHRTVPPLTKAIIFSKKPLIFDFFVPSKDLLTTSIAIWVPLPVAITPPKNAQRKTKWRTQGSTHKNVVLNHLKTILRTLKNNMVKTELTNRYLVRRSINSSINLKKLNKGPPRFLFLTFSEIFR